MNQMFEQAEALFNAISAKLPLVEKEDLSLLADIMQNLEAVGNDTALPPAFRKQAQRTGSLVEKIIMEETPFESGISKLTQSIDKMVKSLAGLINTGGSSDSSEQEEEISGEKNGTAAVSIPDDLRELIIKFASLQPQVLEDFEALCLRYEKSDPDARGALKRLLHTWKGEFGVLDLQPYARLIHSFEEKFEQESFPSESLFRLKDFLGKRIEQFAAGKVPLISPDEITRLFEPLAGINGATKPAGTIVVNAVNAVKSQPAVKELAGQESAGTSQPFNGDPSLLADFVAESREHLDNAEPLLLELEENPGSVEHLNTIFRACHTIKGVAGFLGFTDISHLAHSMENLLDLARKNEVTLTAGHIDVLLQGMDCLREFMAIIEKMLSGGEYALPQNFNEITEKLRDPHALNTQPEASNKKMGEILIERGQAGREEIQSALKKQEGGDTRKVGEILIQDSKVPARDVASALASQSAAKQQKSAVEETIRVPVERLDQLIDSIGEAVIAQSMVYADPAIKAIRNRGLEKNISQASLIMRQIQELSMSLRMVSVKSTFQKMARLVRDLSKKTGKEVDLIIDGEETELDKTVVENIGDPLIHMIRNSVDHGVEPTEERKKAGKPERARINLRAYHKAGSVVIEIADDGKGLDRDAIFKKAVEKGLIKQDAVCTDQEIFQFIFLPGFSTAKVVTDVSGRGVGMDVVRRNIAALRGSVEIISEKGNGTCFTIKLPLTLAIIDGMVVRVRNESYIIPTLSIVESLKPDAGQIEHILEKGETIKVRGNLHTLVRLAHLFDTAANGGKSMDGIVMIVEDMLGKRIAIFVDDIIGQQQVVIKSLGDSMRDIPGVSGGAIMNDGTVSLILDVGAIVRMATV